MYKESKNNGADSYCPDNYAIFDSFILNHFRMLKRCLILLPGFLFLLNVGFAQNSGNYALDEAAALHVYSQTLYDPNGFLYGKEYKLYHYGLETSPLFNASLGMDGTVFANGEAYPAMLAYDIYQDELILLPEIFPEYNFISLNFTVIDSFALQVKPSSKSPLKLTREKIFVFRKVEFPEGSVLKNGYYEVASNNKAKIFIHHEAIQGNNEGEDAVIHGIFRYDYVLKKTLYLHGTYYEIKNKHKFLSLFPEQKKLVNKKLRSFSTPFDQLSAKQLLESVRVANTNQ